MRTTPIPRSAPNSPVLVTGAGGMLGWELARAFREEGDVVACDRASLDVADETSVRAALSRHRPRLIVNAAAFTAVDAAESQREAAFRANVTGPAVLARVAAETGAKLVHFSTDQVFDGSGSTPWTESDVPRPINYYAETKLLGEREALAAPGTLVVRVQWLYGEKKERFTLLRGRTVFHPFADLMGAPSWAKHVAKTVVELAARDAEGVFHWAHDDYASWADVYAYVKELLDLPVVLEPQLTAAAALPAKRPRFCVLSNRKVTDFLGRGLGGWREPLREFLLSRPAARG